MQVKVKWKSNLWNMYMVKHAEYLWSVFCFKYFANKLIQCHNPQIMSSFYLSNFSNVLCLSLPK